MGLQQAVRKWSTRRFFELIDAKRACVFIVLVSEDVLVYNTVVTDANSGAIIYSEETYALKITDRASNAWMETKQGT